jgi:hypothetical protein
LTVVRSCSRFGELLQTISLDTDNSSSRIADMSVAFDGGRVFAVQTDRLYFFTIDDDSANRDFVVKGGLGYCPSSGAIFTITESLLTLANIRSGKVLKRLFFADDHVSDISTSNIDPQSKASSPMMMTMNKLTEDGKSAHHLHKSGSTLRPKSAKSLAAAAILEAANHTTNTNPCLKINPKDQITAAAFGKHALPSSSLLC